MNPTDTNHILQLSDSQLVIVGQAAVPNVADCIFI